MVNVHASANPGLDAYQVLQQFYDSATRPASYSEFPEAGKLTNQKCVLVFPEQANQAELPATIVGRLVKVVPGNGPSMCISGLSTE